MSEKRRQFDKAYKLSAVRLLEQSGKPFELVARGLGISGSMLRRWLDQVRLKGAESFSEAGRQDRQTSSSAGSTQPLNSFYYTAPLKKQGRYGSKIEERENYGDDFNFPQHNCGRLALHANT